MRSNVIGSIVGILGCAGAAAAFPPGVRAVRLEAPAGGDGLTWGTAYNDLQVALAAARLDPLVRELWIAGGTYHAGPPGSPPDTTFRAEHISLYGGFSGIETLRGERDAALNVTTLSGDLNRDGVYSIGDCAPVLTIITTPPVEVDGLRIVGGFAYTLSRAGAIDLAGPASFRDCTIRGSANSSQRFGIRALGPVVFARCSFFLNSDQDSAILAPQGATFSECSGSLSSNYYGNTVLGSNGVNFERCDLSLWGDDRACLNVDTLWVHDSTLRLGNSFTAGLPAVSAGSADLSGCSIIYQGFSNGIEVAGTLRMAACRLGPVPGTDRARIWAGRIEATDCVIEGGRAYSGFLRMQSGWIRNCTFSGLQGSSLPTFDLTSANASISNTILRGSIGSAGVIRVPVGVTGLVNHCCVQGWDPALGGVGNFDLDPLLDGAGRLMPGSPCIDAGSNALAGGAAYDIDGRCRVVDGDGNGVATVDIGASEYTTCAIDCDCATGGPRLTVSDLMCFLNRFGAGEGWANCDGSTGAPALNVLDFNCYLNRFVAGCP